VAAAPLATLEADYLMLHWDGVRWTEARVANNTGEVARFFDIAFNDAGSGWAVGGTTYARYAGP